MELKTKIHIKFWSENLNLKGRLGDLGVLWEVINKMDLT
jgi:hypothetical protein